jgi:hypothetical protein
LSIGGVVGRFYCLGQSSYVALDLWAVTVTYLPSGAQMGFALFATGYFMYLTASWTPNAVVLSVIVFNAAFGYRWGRFSLRNQPCADCS